MNSLLTTQLSRRSFVIGGVSALSLSQVALWPKPAHAANIVDSLRAAAAGSDIVIHKIRGSISVLEGSGGNIGVLLGKDEKVLVDAGITASRPRIKASLAALGAQPVKHLINTHWHFDHTDGNEWLHSEGAAITAHENTRRHLMEAQRVEDWNFIFPQSPPSAVPGTTIDRDTVLELAGSKLAITVYEPAHTDSDLSVHFIEENVVHVGDLFWNGFYPFIDYSTGGSIDGTIAAAGRVIEMADSDTVIISGHGKPQGTLDELKHYHEMLATIRDDVARSKSAGRSVEETIALKPTEAFDDQWGKAIISPAFFTRLVYKGV
ncbi:MBL fold metallo-hydrolase [Agrobacterium sp. AGB01]|uniref:MBL fold metallo-hydrolase n=1 Tax=Agrobacterium sp. AGB01 TaxID=2769302 RepID=UPI00177E9816|nr:MBL fold metallo-hydrolase [Agrobacterium sp. AGB01]MBD9388598.1 MBL fold metallo-hydrolase [Agrobacterium sp. AGB01]